MNVVQICPTPFPSLGGPAQNYNQFHKALNTRTICFVRPREGIGEKMVVPATVIVRTIDFPGLTRYYYTPPSALVAAEQLVARADCLIIHNFYRFPAEWAARTAQKYGIPYLVVLHGIIDPWVFKKNTLLKKAWMACYGRRIFQGASGVLCATEREKSKAEIYLRPNTGKVVHWAVERPKAADIRGRRGRVRQALGLAPEDRVLIYFGRLDSMKRPKETIRLLASMDDERLKLLLVGPDADVSKTELEQLARDLHWNGLRAVGPRFGEEKYDYLHAADAYISLSHRENFNFSAAEAMLCGLPPILSAGNDLGWEFAEDGLSWQLRTPDPAEARRAVASFLEAPRDHIRAMGRAAADWVVVNLSTEKFRRRMHEVVLECVSANQNGG